MSELQVMSREGDSKTIWDVDKPDEVEAARATFDRLRKKGYSAFSVKGDGEKNKRISDFDPQAGAIIMVPQFAGG